ncbi:MAG: MlaD family protein [Planctomycetota bacterium]
MKRSRQDLLLGLVFFAGLAGLVLATLVLTNVRFVDNSQVRAVHFPEVGSLQEGDSVEVLGLRYGLVEKIEFRQGNVPPDERFLVTIRLDEPVEIQNGYEVKISESSLLGGRGIEIDPGALPPVLRDDAVLTGTVELSALDAVGEIFADPEVGRDIRDILSNVADVTKNLNSGNGLIARLINDPTIPDRVDDILESIQGILGDVGDATSPGSQGLLGRVLHSSSLADSVASILDDIELAVSVDGNGIVARLLNGTELRDRIESFIADVELAASPEGTGLLSRVLHSQDLSNNVEQAAEDISGVASNLNDPDGGAAGYLIANEESREFVQRILAEGEQLLVDADEVVNRVLEGDGLIARALNDPDMGEQLSRILNQVSRTIEDVREAAPVSTFASVLIAAF